MLYFSALVGIREAAHVVKTRQQIEHFVDDPAE